MEQPSRGQLERMIHKARETIARRCQDTLALESEGLAGYHWPGDTTTR